jgi:hypothetical protein
MRLPGGMISDVRYQSLRYDAAGWLLRCNVPEKVSSPFNDPGIDWWASFLELAGPSSSLLLHMPSFTI